MTTKLFVLSQPHCSQRAQINMSNWICSYLKRAPLLIMFVLEYGYLAHTVNTAKIMVSSRVSGTAWDEKKACSHNNTWTWQSFLWRDSLCISQSSDTWVYKSSLRWSWLTVSRLQTTWRGTSVVLQDETNCVYIAFLERIWKVFVTASSVSTEKVYIYLCAEGRFLVTDSKYLHAGEDTLFAKITIVCYLAVIWCFRSSLFPGPPVKWVAVFLPYATFLFWQLNRVWHLYSALKPEEKTSQWLLIGLDGWRCLLWREMSTLTDISMKTHPNWILCFGVNVLWDVDLVENLYLVISLAVFVLFAELARLCFNINPNVHPKTCSLYSLLTLYTSSSPSLLCSCNYYFPQPYNKCEYKLW